MKKGCKRPIIKTNLRILRDESGFTQKDFAEMLQIDVKTYGKLEKADTPNMRIDTLITICDTLVVSADYVLNRSSCRSVENDKIQDITGLSNDSIETLKTWNKYRKAPQAGIVSYGASDLEMLNTILSDWHKRDCDCKKAGNMVGWSLFHFIRGYVFADKFKREPLQKVRYRSENKFDDIQIGDSITGSDGSSHKIEQLYTHGVWTNTPSESDNISIYNTENENEVYNIKFSELYKTRLRDTIIEYLDKLKERL